MISLLKRPVISGVNCFFSCLHNIIKLFDDSFNEEDMFFACGGFGIQFDSTKSCPLKVSSYNELSSNFARRTGLIVNIKSCDFDSLPIIQETLRNKKPILAISRSGGFEHAQMIEGINEDLERILFCEPYTIDPKTGQVTVKQYGMTYADTIANTEYLIWFTDYKNFTIPQLELSELLFAFKDQFFLNSGNAITVGTEAIRNLIMLMKNNTQIISDVNQIDYLIYLLRIRYLFFPQYFISLLSKSPQNDKYDLKEEILQIRAGWDTCLWKLLMLQQTYSSKNFMRFYDGCMRQFEYQDQVFTILR